MTLPHVLIIDDQAFWGVRHRRRLCEQVGLLDITTGSTVLAPPDPIAEAEFAPGQRWESGRLQNSIEAALDSVGRGWDSGTERAGMSPEPPEHRWALVLLDLSFAEGAVSAAMPDPRQADAWPVQSDPGFGEKILREMVSTWPDAGSEEGGCEVPVVVLSSIVRSRGGHGAARAGARAYVEKEKLDRRMFEELLDEHGLLEDQGVAERRAPDQLLRGRSRALLKTLREARWVARMRGGNAMILGPQGCGKSSLARYIHARSGRPGRLVEYFVLPTAANLEYAALFGYWIGAHSEALESRAGKAEEAHHGTLLIDEFHALRSDSQQEFLQFGRLVDGKRWLRRLGNFPLKRSRKSLEQARESVLGDLDETTHQIAVDPLVLCASNLPLDDPDWRERAGFNEALYTRFAHEYAGGPIRFPALSDRLEDLPFLFDAFLERETSGAGGVWPKQIDDGVLPHLMRYPWPGNVAELEGVARYAARKARLVDVLMPHHLPRLRPDDRQPHSGHRGRVSRQVVLPPDGLALRDTREPAAESPTGNAPAAIDDLDAVISAMDRLEVRPDVNEIRGGLKRLGEAFGRLAGRLIDAATSATQGALQRGRSSDLGTLRPTSALKMLFERDEMTATQAADLIKRLAFFLPATALPDSLARRLVDWARRRRPTPGDRRPVEGEATAENEPDPEA